MTNILKHEPSHANYSVIEALELPSTNQGTIFEHVYPLLIVVQTDL